MKNIILILMALAVISCNTGSFTTEAGTEVNYLVKGDGDLPIDTLVGLYVIRYTTEDGKVIMEPDSENPLPLKIDPSNERQQGELYEVLSLLETGDSVSFDLEAADLFLQSFRTQVPDSIPARSRIQFQVAYVEQITEDVFFQRQAQKLEENSKEQLAIDEGILATYLEQNNIEAARTESGLRYVITEEGNGGKPESGQIVQVNYAGRILDGTYFDTSIESVAREQGLFQEGRPYQPLSFALGMGRVIKGWDEGIALLDVGSSATLYIPSPLGYGPNGSRPVIGPNAILVFDVELVGIE